MKIVRNILLTLIALIILMLASLNLSSVQRFLAQKAASILANRLHTKVSVGNVRIDFLNKVLLQELYIEDHSGDTLAYIGEASLHITDWFVLKKEVPVLKYIGLKNAYIHLYRKRNSADWNYGFIEAAFAGNDTPAPKKKKDSGFELDLKKIRLDNVRFHMDDAWGGYDYDIDVGHFATTVSELNFKKRIATISEIALERSSIRMKDYIGGKPPSPKKPQVIDTTPFNPGNWQLAIARFDLDDCHFLFKSKETAPYPNEFDPEHIEVSQLTIQVRDIYVKGDTVSGDLQQFTAAERSGFLVKHMHSKVTVSPVASICDSLYLETNNSQLHDYYAMHYDRFPDFEDYIEKVVMVARLRNSVVATRDIAYFAPALRELQPMMLKLTGNGKGTVAKLNVTDFFLSDGFSTAKGDITFTGLPDIDATQIDYRNGELFTTGSSILKYAPVLKNNPNINLNTLEYAYFNGSFNGLLQDFSAKGSFRTNLGNIVADIQMKLPDRQPPTYAGHIRSAQFDIGRLLNQDIAGPVTLDATLQGASFDEKGFHIKANSTIESITLNGYSYKNIIADGIFEKQQFTGNLLVNDSNLSMGFNGSIDFSKKDLVINATANVLHCDLQALKLTSVPTLLTGDFDLNCSGKTIDDFSGSAKLYNINLRRNAKRMDLDSIAILTYETEGRKQINIESNLLSANINGQFRLTEIPNSTIYYLSQYLPNYIKGPTKVATDQDISFSIRTHQINDMLMAFSDQISGFDSSDISGTLNTSKQSLTLSASIPYGKTGPATFYNASITGKGDWNKLFITGNVAGFKLGKDILNTSLTLDASIGRDSLLYKIATQSTEQYGTATLSGRAYARGDSLFMTFLPSEVFLNNVKWEIPSGSYMAYSDHYLYIRDLFFNAGVQQLSLSSETNSGNAPLLIRSSNLDLALLASLTPLSSYQPDGRINGDILVKDLFGHPVIDANIKATGVKLGADTIGTIVLNGDYNTKNNLIALRSESGIFNEHFSLTGDGNISLDPKATNAIDGQVTIKNLPMKLLAPFLQGYAGKISGTADGLIRMSGNTSRPEMDGKLTLNNIGARIDYTGAYYTIPSGTILLDKQTARLDDITIYDVYQHTATASGTINLANISNVGMNIQLKSPQFEIINLKDYENELFYGHAVANTDFSISGTVSDMRMNIRVTPTQTSHLYIPYNSAGDISQSTYISFKSYGSTPTFTPRRKDKLSVTISAILNTLLDITFVIDPATGDQINATGSGNMVINVPSNDDYSMFGNYNIEKGSYTFTFRQVLSKTFNINSGSSINFNGSLANTRLDIYATYPSRARLYDLLDRDEILQLGNSKDLEDAKAQQPVNVLLRMQGTLSSTDLSYEIDLPEKRSIGTYAYSKLTRINQSDKSSLTNQVGALLILGSFVPQQGISSNMAMNSAKNTFGETIANSASPILTNALNKIIGDNTLSVLVQYKSYSSSDNLGGSASNDDATNRNELKFGLKKNFNDRLSVQVGSAYDWGRPTAANTTSSSFNLAGDFRAQYLLTPDGGISLTGFRTSNYDVIVNDNISRTGVGITFRKSFDNLFEFFHSKKRVLEQQQKKRQAIKKPAGN